MMLTDKILDRRHREMWILSSSMWKSKQEEIKSTVSKLSTYSLNIFFLKGNMQLWLPDLFENIAHFNFVLIYIHVCLNLYLIPVLRWNILKLWGRFYFLLCLWLCFRLPMNNWSDVFWRHYLLRLHSVPGFGEGPPQQTLAFYLLTFDVVFNVLLLQT